MTRRQESRRAFLEMLRVRRPEIYQRVIERASRAQGRGLSGLGETAVTVDNQSWWDKLIAGIQQLAPTYAQYQLSKDLYDLNMQRAKQGLPPVDASAVSPQMNVGLSPETRLLVLGMGGVALIAVLALARRRRR